MGLQRRVRPGCATFIAFATVLAHHATQHPVAVATASSRSRPDSLTIDGWADYLGTVCPTIPHEPFEQEVEQLLVYTRRRLYSRGEPCKHCIVEESTVPMKTCTDPKTGLRGLCIGVAAEESFTVIRRRQTTDSTEATIFGVAQKEMLRLLNGLGPRDALRCNLALWPYNDKATHGTDTMLLPLAPTAFMNHADESDDDEPRSASVWCGFSETDVAFVEQCITERSLAAGESLTYDYWENFYRDADWFVDFKKRAGIRVRLVHPKTEKEWFL